MNKLEIPAELHALCFPQSSLHPNIGSPARESPLWSRRDRSSDKEYLLLFQRFWVWIQEPHGDSEPLLQFLNIKRDSSDSHGHQTHTSGVYMHLRKHKTKVIYEIIIDQS